MYERYFESFRKKAHLSDEEQEIVKGYLSVKKIRKRQYLLQEGDVDKVIAFVEKGTLRSYSVDEDGNEHIVQFAIEGWFISDLYSFLTGEPATYNIDALEDSELVVISRSAYDELLLKSTSYQTYIFHQITSAYIALQKRITSSNSLSPEQRYKSFIATYPEIVQRIPQHMIASYLGVKPETLSRIRRRMVL